MGVQPKSLASVLAMRSRSGFSAASLRYGAFRVLQARSFDSGDSAQEFIKGGRRYEKTRGRVSSSVEKTQEFGRVELVFIPDLVQKIWPGCGWGSGVRFSGSPTSVSYVRVIYVSAPGRTLFSRTGMKRRISCPVRQSRHALLELIPCMEPGERLQRHTL